MCYAPTYLADSLQLTANAPAPSSALYRHDDAVSAVDAMLCHR